MTQQVRSALRSIGTLRLAALVLTATLLTAAIVTGVGFTPVVADDPPEHGFRFEEAAQDIGFVYDATNEANFGNGRVGIYVTDYDNDDWPDLLAIGGERPILFENDRGRYSRADVLPVLERRIRGALVFDHDRDGWEDLLLLPLDGEPVFLENRRGTFERRDAGFDRPIPLGVGATAADFDGNGCLDVFVYQNGDWREHTPKLLQNRLREEQKGGGDGPVEDDNGESNHLFWGDCSGFEHDDSAGISGAHWTTAASAVDLTGDDRPDIHVANDFSFDVLYVNRGDGSFERRELPDTNRHEMASEVADVNGDGAFDVFVTSVHHRPLSRAIALSEMNNDGNNLLVNRGNGTFDSLEVSYGVYEGGWGWAGSLEDFDNDGDRDLVHATRYYREFRGIHKSSPLVRDRPRVFERDGDRFQKRSAKGAGFGETDGKGLVNLDYDRDGDQDIVIANSAGAFALYENRYGGADWLQVEAVDGEGATAIGATVTVVADGRTQVEPLNAKADFRSQDTRSLHFGLGDVDGGASVRVRVAWPDGTERTVTTRPNQRIVVPKSGPVRHIPGDAETGLLGGLSDLVDILG